MTRLEPLCQWLVRYGDVTSAGGRESLRENGEGTGISYLLLRSTCKVIGVVVVRVQESVAR